MKEVYYKGQPYQYQIIELGGKRHFQLYKNGVMEHLVEQSDLDIKSIVSLILDAYYKNTQPKVQSQVLQ
jgi:hypothetical protein